ncbi:hypothetical protein Zmor_017845 [Zophobas morio]|uniref:CRAL-TRIO domain-containing protein n=1 Tax=Zophobas morio TaxID=2755281 RepID=A0AA38IDB3_9CUCU|nr:hypothetical protein Zmor_017845 [Zophobas morio]
MSVQFIDIETEYEKNKQVQRKQVRKFMDWINQQPHLPKITEFQALTFLHSCYYDEDAAKKTADVFFTVKTSNPNVFRMRDPHKLPTTEGLDVTVMSMLPKKTPKGYTILYIKLIDPDPRHLNMATQVKIFDMTCMLHLHQTGITEGYVAMLDMQEVALRHLFRLSPSALKALLYYISEGIPGRIMEFHFVNTIPFIINKVLTLIKPLLSKKIYDIIHVHSTVEDSAEFIPIDCLPEDYGGSAEAISVIHEKSKQKLLQNEAFFEWEDTQVVDESLRPKKKSYWFSWG